MNPENRWLKKAEMIIEYNAQNIELLNEVREKLEDMLCRISDEYSFYRPRMYKMITIMIRNIGVITANILIKK